MEPSLTIDEFCLAEKISRSTFYNMEKIGKAPKYELHKPFDPVERAKILKALGWKSDGRPSAANSQNIGSSANSENILSFPEAAAKAGYGNEETARQALTVVDHGTPELVEAYRKEEISTSAAAVIAQQPAEEQKRIVSAPKPARKAAVRSLRKPTKPVTHVPPRPSPSASVESFDAVSTRIPCRNPKAAAVTIIAKMSRDDIRDLVTALQTFLDTMVLQ